MSLPKLRVPAQGFGVRFKLEQLDRSGRVVSTQSGRNMITDSGMNSLAVVNPDTLVDYLNLSSTTEVLKRVASGEVLTVTYSDAATITLTSDTNFFEAGDVGRTFQLLGWPEMLITGFTSALEVTATARAGLWLPGFTPPASPSGSHTDWGVHYTEKATLGTEFTRFNTYDTGAANFDTELNDDANSRTIWQRIFLSAEVTGSPWTVNQLGWSANSANCFGKTNLGSPEIVPIGNKLRVTLQVLSTKTPIDLTGVSLDWGGTVGTHTCDIRMERIGYDWRVGGIAGSPLQWNFLRPFWPSSNTAAGWWTGAFTMSGIGWEGGSGFTNLSGRTGRTEFNITTGDSAYNAGDFYRTRRIAWPDTQTITAATGLFVGRRETNGSQLHFPALTIRPQSGTITKPGGYIIGITFPLHWTRELLN